MHTSQDHTLTVRRPFLPLRQLAVDVRGATYVETIALVIVALGLTGAVLALGGAVSRKFLCAGDLVRSLGLAGALEASGYCQGPPAAVPDAPPANPAPVQSLLLTSDFVGMPPAALAAHPLTPLEQGALDKALAHCPQLGVQYQDLIADGWVIQYRMDVGPSEMDPRNKTITLARDNLFSPSKTCRVLAHEMAHVYYGTVEPLTFATAEAFVEAMLINEGNSLMVEMEFISNEPDAQKAAQYWADFEAKRKPDTAAIYAIYQSYANGTITRAEATAQLAEFIRNRNLGNGKTYSEAFAGQWYVAQSQAPAAAAPPPP